MCDTQHWWVDTTSNWGRWECRTLDHLLSAKVTICHFFCHDREVYEEMMAYKLIVGGEHLIHRWDFGSYPKAFVDTHGNLHRAVFHVEPQNGSLRNNRSLKEFA